MGWVRLAGGAKARAQVSCLDISDDTCAAGNVVTLRLSEMGHMEWLKRGWMGVCQRPVSCNLEFFLSAH